MKPVRAALMIAAAVALTACAAPNVVATRGASSNGPLLGQEGSGPVAPLARSYHVTAVNVTVPETLTVSEANSYKPRADIVWREDPTGDRYSQVDKIITDAVTEAVAGMNGRRDVTLEIVVTRFHALTELTRFSAPPGLATHDVKMTLAVLDSKTGEVIEPARPIGFEIEAHTSGQAMADIAQGITQKMNITSAVVTLIQNELATPPTA